MKITIPQRIKKFLDINYLFWAILYLFVWVCLKIILFLFTPILGIISTKLDSYTRSILEYEKKLEKVNFVDFHIRHSTLR